MGLLNEKVVIITVASRGIGLGIVETLVKKAPGSH
jgi:NAD(P)-dependent dehydrogenase (short-subunit alcohol dehydrogenase family)